MSTIHRNLFLWAFTLLLTVPATGQIILQGGMNVASLRITGQGLTLETDSKVGFHAGAGYIHKINENLHFVPGLYYSQKGARFFDGDSDFNYLDIMTLFAYQLKPEGGIFLETGPYLGILLEAVEGDFFDVKENYNTLELGFSLGIGYDMQNWRIGGRGALSIADIAKDDPGTNSSGSIFNSVGQVYLAFKI